MNSTKGGAHSPQALLHEVINALPAYYEAQEARALAQWLLEATLGLTTAKVLVNDPLPYNTTQQKAFTQALHRVRQGEPIQYVLGNAPFYGHEFEVSPAVLIPRPETEELVHWVLGSHNWPSPPRLLDAGTGSGCIGLSLGQALPGSQVWLVDKSPAALEVAGRNAKAMGLNPLLQCVDLLQEPLPVNDLGLLVSNPPYVRQSERSLMRANVLNHEPSLALFVEDASPLIFYERLAQLGQQALAHEGWLYVEINEAFGPQVVKLFEQAGYQKVTLAADLNGRHRMVRGCKTSA